MGKLLLVTNENKRVRVHADTRNRHKSAWAFSGAIHILRHTAGHASVSESFRQAVIKTTFFPQFPAMVAPCQVGGRRRWRPASREVEKPRVRSGWVWFLIQIFFTPNPDAVFFVKVRLQFLVELLSLFPSDNVFVLYPPEART